MDKKICSPSKETVLCGAGYLLQYLFFTYVLYRFPPLGDRYMESTILFSFENLWRYIYTQRFWLTHANGRIFSNLGTCLIDASPLLLRALVYSGVILACSVIMNRLCKNKSKVWTTLFSFLLLVSVSEGIKSEVYYYATGLYMTSFLFLLLCLWIITTSWEKQPEIGLTRSVLYRCIIIFFASAWLESISIPINIALWLIMLYCAVRHNAHFKMFLRYCAFSTAGFLLLASSMLYVTVQGRGKLAGTSISLTDSDVILNMLEKLYVSLIQDNSWLLLLFVSCAVLVVIYEKWLSKTWEKWAFGILSGIVGLFLLTNIAFGVYRIVSTDASTEYNRYATETTMGWRRLGHAGIRTFFEVYCLNFWGIAAMALVMWGIVFLFFALKRAKDKIYYFVFASFIFGGVLIGLPPIGWSDPRVISSAVFMVVAFTAFLAKKIPLKHNAIVIVLAACLIFECGNMFLTCETEGRAEDIRQARATFAAQRQGVGDWNYDTDYIVFPPSQFNKAKFKIGDLRYCFFLHHYGLSPQTKIIYEGDVE